MNTFLLTVSTPSGKVFEDDALCLSARGTLGSLAVMAGHVPFTTALKEGEIKITLHDETEKTLKIAQGVLSVTKERVTVLTNKAE